MKNFGTLSLTKMCEDLVKYSAEAEKYVQLYNELNSSENRKPADVAEARKKAEDACVDYTNTAKLVTYKELEETDNPIIEAIIRLDYPSLSIKEAKQENAKAPAELEVKRGTKPIDLIDIAKVTEFKFHNNDWQKLAKEMNCKFVYAACADCGVSYKFADEFISMIEIRKSIEKKERPLALENMTSALYACIEAIIGPGYAEVWNTSSGKCDSEGEELTVGNCFVNLTHRAFSKKSKKVLQLTCGNHKDLVRILAEICHGLVTGETISIESKFIETAIKKEKRKAEKEAKKAAEKAAAEKAKAENDSADQGDAENGKAE